MSLSSVFLSSVFYSLVDDGVANLLGLETLRHGTNPVSNVLIRFKGGNPALGGVSYGSGGATACRQNFYLFKDSEYILEESSRDDLRYGPFPSRCFHLIRAQQGIGNRIVPRIHAALSGFSCIAGRNAWAKDLTQHSFVKLSASYFTGAFCFFFSPTIRFRFSKIEENFSGVEGRFQNDEEYAGLAYRTKQAVEPWRIGLTGSLITGLNFSWYSRVKANPWKVLTGVVQLVCAVAMAILYFHIAIANPISVTVGMLLA